MSAMPEATITVAAAFTTAGSYVDVRAALGDVPPKSVMAQLVTAGTVVAYSFDGITQHGRMAYGTPSQVLSWGAEDGAGAIKVIYFKQVSGGAATVYVSAEG